jgi:hypothetical protein
MEFERAIRLSSQTKAKQCSYATLSLHCDQLCEWKLTPNERYAKINQWRFHRPTILERRNLKIPQGILKLDLQDLSHVLILCGGNQLVEFSIQVSGLLQCVFASLSEGNE